MTAAVRPPLDGAALQAGLQNIQRAGIHGVYSSVRAGDRVWRGAAGVVDLANKRPLRPGMYHRAGSVAKTFTAAAVLRQVEKGAIDLDAPVNRYVPGLIPGERGKAITVRMALNHTSHIGDHVAALFNTPGSFEANRLRSFTREHLVKLGLEQPSTGVPGSTPGAYSNTNYAIAGLVLERVTGVRAEDYVTREVIGKAGLRHTFFPTSHRLPQPHSKAYEGLGGLFDPELEVSDYNPSWANMGGALVSSMDGLNRFYRALLQGRIIGQAMVTEMQRTVPVDVGGPEPLAYGLGIARETRRCGEFWTNTGRVWGMSTLTYSSRDGMRQVSIGYNRGGYVPAQPDPVEEAQERYIDRALCAAVAPHSARS
ncbi:serine hydrolase domain-containing protein [Nonomuraea sp. NPDC003754]